MEQNTMNMEIFTGEVLGVATLVFFVLSTEFFLERKQFKGFQHRLLFAIGASIGILFALLIPHVIPSGKSHINPGSTLMFAIIGPEEMAWHSVPFAIGGQFVGGFTGIAVASLVHWPLSKLNGDHFVRNVLTFETQSSKSHITSKLHHDDKSIPTETLKAHALKGFFTEIFGMFVLMFIVATSVLTTPSIVMNPELVFIMVSLGLFLVLLIYGDLHNLLNLSVAFPMLIVKAIVSKGVGLKTELVTLGVQIIPNLAMAAAVGGLFHGIAVFGLVGEAADATTTVLRSFI